MNKELLQQIARKIRNKHSFTEQFNKIPKELTTQEQNYVKQQLRTHEYYKNLKQQQIQKREQDFYNTFTTHNPYKSNNTTIANQKERQIMRKALKKHITKTRTKQLLKNYVIPCDKLTSTEQKILTDPLLISIIDKRLRPYTTVRATKIGTNKITSYLIKQNWKRESINHLVWKFELRQKYNFRIEQKIGQYRADLLKKHNIKNIIIEITCTRQSITPEFKNKIRTLTAYKKNIVIILAPVRLHKYLTELQNVNLANAKTIIALLERLLAQ